MELFYTLLGLAIFAGNIISTIYVFGGMKKSPKWVLITAGILNILMLFAVLGMVE